MIVGVRRARGEDEDEDDEDEDEEEDPNEVYTKEQMDVMRHIIINKT